MAARSVVAKLAAVLVGSLFVFGAGTHSVVLAEPGPTSAPQTAPAALEPAEEDGAATTAPGTASEPEPPKQPIPAATGIEDARPGPLVWGGSFGIASAIGAAGAASGLLLASESDDDSTAKWTSIGLFIGAGVALVVGVSLVIVGATADDDAQASAPSEAEPVAGSTRGVAGPTVALTPTAGGLVLHGRF